MPQKRTFKYWIGQIHLWLGLVSGIVVLIVSVTGCLFVFQTEISNITYKKTFFIAPGNANVLPLSILKENAQQALGTGQPINYITTFKRPDMAWEFMAYKTNDTALTYFGGTEYFRSVFINPYTGQATGFRDYKYDFFNIVKYLHWSLLLNSPYGQPIVGWSTLIFVVLLITGLILWYPKKWNKAARRQSFTIKWKTKFKRLNYDLHNVLGFYSLLFALIIALTGMVFAFSWFQATVYVVASGSTKAPEQFAGKSIPDSATGKLVGLNRAYGQTAALYPNATRIGISPAYGNEGVIYASAYRGKEIYYDRDDLQFDQYSGKLLHTQLAAQKNNGQRIIDMNYDIHVGAIGGLAGKIIAFIASFICASLPVTGFLIWWGKRKKSKPQQKKSGAGSQQVRN